MNVVQYWERIAQSTGDPRGWNDLNPEYQHMVIESLNLLIFVLNNR